MSELSFQTPHGTIHGMQYGEGEVCLALHGWLDNAATWSVLAPQLKFRVIALDLPGHGHSSHRAGPYHIWDSLSDLLAIVQQLDETPHWLGHSMGAGIATLFAGCFPEHARSLNLVEGFGPWVEPKLNACEQLRRAAIAQQWPAKTPRPYASLEQATQIRASRGVSTVAPQAIRPIVERAMKPVEAGWVWRADPALSQPSPLKLEPHQIKSCIQTISCPIRIALGSQGMLVDKPEFSERLDWAQACQMRVFEGDHHLHCYPQAAYPIAQWFNQDH